MSEKQSFWSRLGGSLGRTRQKIGASLSNMMAGQIDENTLEELEEALITSDVGVNASALLIERLKDRRGEAGSLEDLQNILRQEMQKVLQSAPPLAWSFEHTPQVVMVVGVNGVGKTTSIAKLAYLFKSQGKKVILGAGDTFRAAASEQLLKWGERVGCPVVWQKSGADPSGVAFQALDEAISQGCDLLLLDTAGRLHTKVNLMEELKKIHRVLNKRLEGAPHKTLLVLDASTGQNAVNQARMFNQATPVDGLVLTKLDGSAKGGVVLSLCAELKMPVCFIGQGESMEDLKEFDAHEFVRAIV